MKIRFIEIKASELRDFLLVLQLKDSYAMVWNEPTFSNKGDEKRLLIIAFLMKEKRTSTEFLKNGTLEFSKEVGFK